MSKGDSIQRAMLSSRRVPRWVMATTLLVLAMTIGLTTRQVRTGIREQMIGRDAAVLHAVVTTQLDEQASLEWEDADGGDVLRAVLLASRLKGVIGTRLFATDGTFLESFPPLVREDELPADRLPGLRRGEPGSRYLSAVDPVEIFYASNGNGLDRERLPLLVVEVPMHATSDPRPLGIAQFLIEGHSTAMEFERLDRRLATQALAVFAVAGVVLSWALSWAFGRLRRTQGLLADQTRHLEQANSELARAARTAAVGAITAHLIHGLRSPLTGLQHYVASLGNGEGGNGAQEWETAVITTRRMQSLINEVVNVLREEEAASAYDVSVDELLGLVRGRVDGVAAERRVDLELSGGMPVRLMNRTANLLKLVLVNLVDNAIQATPAGRRVRVEVDGDEKLLRFRVRDQGSGFPEATVGNVFAPRRSTREGGAGIGLAISKQLADYLGATLELESSSSTGCVFALRLPVGTEPEELGGVTVSSGRWGHGNQRG